MALKTQYFCKNLGDYVKPLRLDSRAQGGLTIITGLNCEYHSVGFCRQYGGVCKPYKKAKKDARYDARKHAEKQTPCGVGRGLDMHSAPALTEALRIAEIRASQPRRPYDDEISDSQP